jgi:hypothetical protein
MNSPNESLQSVSIERVRGITPDFFDQVYLAGPGKPVIVTDALKSWAAPSLWTFELFKSRYGEDTVSPQTWSGNSSRKLMKFREFLSYLDEPEGRVPGFWIDPATLHPCPGPAELAGSPLYLAWNVFGKHPELLDEIELSPGFVEDWLPLLPPAFRSTLDSATRYFSAGLMIGPKNATIGLHQDFLHSHAYLAQIVGQKKCVLFSPEDSAALYGGKVDIDAPDLDQFPLFRKATAYECTLEPGELLFLPSRWWHYVVSLEKSITVNYNFFNRVNFGAYLTDLLQALPALVRGLEKSPEAMKALRIKWTCRGFDFPALEQR